MKHLPLRQAYAFGANYGIGKEVEEIRRTPVRYKSYTSSVRRGLIIELFEKRGLFEKFKDAHWNFGHSPQGNAAIERYRNIRALRGSSKSRI